MGDIPEKSIAAWTNRFAASVAAIAISLATASASAQTSGASADGGLVLDGEVVADAKLFEAAKAEGFLLSYTTNFENLERRVLDEFKADTGISYDIVRLGSGRMLERVLSEKAAGELRADLISNTDLKMAGQLVEAGIWAPHTVPNDAKIPDNCKEENRHWYFENMFPTTLAYNKAVLKADPPTSWKDLVKPEYNNQFGVVRAGTGGSSWNLSLFMRKEFGLDYWKELAANKPLIYTSQAPLMEDVARGEAPIGAVTIGLFAEQLAAGAPVGIVFPEEGIPTVPNIIGVSATAQNPNAARLFMNWVLAKRGAKAIQDITLDYSCNPDVGSPALPEHGLQAPDRSKLWTASTEDWIGLRDAWVVEWDSLFGK